MTASTDERLFPTLGGETPDWGRYDALELHGGALVEIGNGEFVIETGVDDDEVDAYSIQAHLKTGGTEDLVDARTYAEAIALLQEIAERSGLPVHHYVAAPATPPEP
jgi:hypothetical protein